MKSTKNSASDVEAGPGAPRSKADRAYAFIRQRVLDGQRTPGERLVIEHLAREMDVSVVPVREAIRRLEAEGYITYTRNVGATVASIDLDRYPETVETLAILEGVAIGLAGPHITAKDIKDARALNEQMRACVDSMDPTKFTAINMRFHNILYSRLPQPSPPQHGRRNGLSWPRRASRRLRSSPSVPSAASPSTSRCCNSSSPVVPPKRSKPSPAATA